MQEVVNLARCARPTLSQLHLGKQAGTGAQSTFEGDGRPPETHLWRPLASMTSHEEGGHTPRRHTHIYGHKTTLAAPRRTKVRCSVCTPRDRLLVKVPRSRAYPLRALGGRFISTVINLWGDIREKYSLQCGTCCVSPSTCATRVEDGQG